MQLAQQRADGQHGRLRQPERVVGRGQADQVQFEFAVGLVGVHGAGRHPDGAGGRRDPGARAVVTASTPAPGVDDLVVVVAVRVDRRPGASCWVRVGAIGSWRIFVIGWQFIGSTTPRSVAEHGDVAKNKSIILLAVGHACVDVYQGAVAALVPFFVAERAYSYAAVSGIVLAASLLSSVAQPLFGLLTDRWAMPWLLPVSTMLGGLGIALSGVSGSYALTLVFVAVSGIGVAAYHPESARVARLASGGSHTRDGLVLPRRQPRLRAGAPHGRRGRRAPAGLRLTPLLVVPALAGSVLCLPVLRALERRPLDRTSARRRPGATTGPRS